MPILNLPKLSNLHAGLPLYLETWENMQKSGIWQLKIKALENLEFDKSKKKNWKNLEFLTCLHAKK